MRFVSYLNEFSFLVQLYSPMHVLQTQASDAGLIQPENPPTQSPPTPATQPSPLSSCLSADLEAAIAQAISQLQGGVSSGAEATLRAHLAKVGAAPPESATTDPGLSAAQTPTVDPRTSIIFCILGDLLRERGDFEGASAEFEAALAIDPTIHNARRNLG